MARLPPYYRQIIVQHQRRLERLVRRRGVAQLKKLYDEANDALVARMAREHGRTFTGTVRRSLLMQIRAGQMSLAQRLGTELGAASLDTQIESIRALARNLRMLERKYTGAVIPVPIEEAARFRGIIDKRRTSLLRAHETSMARYGARVVGKMERQLSLSLVTGQNTAEAIDELRAVADLEWFQAERIARTELAWAYNATHADSVASAAEELPDMMMRWNEHVTDTGYQPMDARVGDDSLAMHGQLAPPGGSFVMPPTTRTGKPISPSLVGRRWTHPPNRPNDRAVLSPWRPHWGVPGWIWKGGRRVPLTRV